MEHHWRLFVTITPLIQSMEGNYYGQVCIWYLLCNWCCQCLLHLYVLANVSVVVLGAHLCCQCLLHLAYMLTICVYCGAWSVPGAVYLLTLYNS